MQNNGAQLKWLHFGAMPSRAQRVIMQKAITTV